MAVAIQLEGTTDYEPCHQAMEALVDARAQGRVPDVILLVEHAATITVGRARHASNNVLDAGPLPVVPVARGGDVTVHGPGQLVAYPIIALPEGRRDLMAHLRHLEQAVIDLLSDLGLSPLRDPRNTGVWLPRSGGRPKKVAAVGIACRRWVTWHGLALNLQIDLANFERVHPCGMDLDAVTRLADHLDPCPVPAALAPALVPYLARHLGVSIEGPVRVEASPAAALAGLGVQR